MNVNEVNAKVASKASRHRVGRGPGSGRGKTSGRGQDGAKSRSGAKNKTYAEGGQMAIQRRLPKRGFNNDDFGKQWSFVNMTDLNQFADGDVVTPEECLRRGLIPKIRSGLKVLGQGALERRLTVKAHRASAAARKAVEEKGGTIDLVPAKGDEAAKVWRARRGQGKATRRRKKAEGRSK